MFFPGWAPTRFKAFALWIILIMISTFPACGPSRTDRDVSRFAAEFSAIPPENTKAYDTLLRKYQDKIPGTNDTAELIRANVLIALGRYDEADNKIQGLLKRKSSLDTEARLAKVRILIYTGKQEDAFKMYRAIEDKINGGKEQASINLYFAQYGPNAATRAEYAQKALSAGVENLDLYRVMSADARLAGDLSAARNDLEKALEAGNDESGLQVVRGELAKLDLLGKDAPLFKADRWLNRNLVEPFPAQLKGKPVVLVFRAPWCSASRGLTQMLRAVNEESKGDGLIIVDCMKLYGFYRDGSTNSTDSAALGPLTVEEEVNLIRGFLREQGITWPVALNYEGIPFEDYHVTHLPALFFIDKTGSVQDFETGAGHSGRIEQKIKRLMTQ